jgi:hypothetical protein
MTTGLGTESGLGVRCEAGCPHSREPGVSEQVGQRAALLATSQAGVVFRVRQGNNMWCPEDDGSRTWTKPLETPHRYISAYVSCSQTPPRLRFNGGKGGDPMNRID